MNYEFMFDDFESLQVWLRQIDDGTIEGDLSRWVFMDVDGNKGKTNTKSKGSARKTRRYDSDVEAVVDEAQKDSP